jgi:hypothetical protein
MSAVDLDGDGIHELVVFGYDVHSPGNFWLFAFGRSLTPLPSWTRSTGISKFLAPAAPVFADMDLDGSLEYFIAVYELVSGQVFGWHSDGVSYSGDSILAMFAVTDSPARIYSPVFGDVNTDGFVDLLTCASPDLYYTFRSERIVAWDRYGRTVPGWPIFTTTQARYVARRQTPVLGDIDNDGHLDLMMTTADNDLVFHSFPNQSFVEGCIQVECWRYNRRLNNTAPFIISTSTTVSDTEWPAAPTSFALEQNFPNPFNSTTTIEFSLQRSTEVKVTIFNILGQVVYSVDLGSRSAGKHWIEWNAREADGEDLPSGIYFYRVRAGEQIRVGKMLLLK